MIRKQALSLHLATTIFFTAGILAVLAFSGCKQMEVKETVQEKEPDRSRELFDTVLVVFNGNSQKSRSAAGDYLEKHNIPFTNICSLDLTDTNRISSDYFEDKVRKNIQDSLERAGMNRIKHIILCDDIPLFVDRIQKGDSIQFDVLIASVWKTFPGGFKNTSMETKATENSVSQENTAFFPEYTVLRLTAPGESSL